MDTGCEEWWKQQPQITTRLTKLAVNALELKHLESKGISKDVESLPLTGLYRRLKNLKLRNPKENLKNCIWKSQ